MLNLVLEPFRVEPSTHALDQKVKNELNRLLYIKVFFSSRVYKMENSNSSDIKTGRQIRICGDFKTTINPKIGKGILVN